MPFGMGEAASMKGHPVYEIGFVRVARYVAANASFHSTHAECRTHASSAEHTSDPSSEDEHESGSGRLS